MKVGVVCGLVYPFATGGPAIVAYNLVRHLASKNIRVTLFGGMPTNTNISDLQKHYPNVELMLHTERGISSIIYSQFTYLKQITSIDFDILHFEVLPGARGACLLPMLHRLNKNTKIVQKIHGYPPLEVNLRFSNVVSKLFYRFHWKVSKVNISHFCDALIVNSVWMKNAIERDFSKVDTEVIPNGVDLNFWKNGVDMNLEGGKNIIFWGRFSEEKGVDLIIKAAKTILEEFPNTHFYLIGDGPLSNSLIGLVIELKLESNIHFTGFLPQKEIIAYASSSDVVIFPSRYESFGMMVIEAMALKKPVIGTNVGGIKEIIQSYKNGILVSPDSNEISKVIINLLKNNELQNTLSREAYETSMQYDWSKICEMYIEFYEKLIGEYT